MSETKIRGNTQIKPLSITNDQISISANISTSKLAEGQEFLKRDGSIPLIGDLNLDGNKIINLGQPTNANDAIRKIDLENAIDEISSGIFITREIPTGTIDGINKIFTLSNIPDSGTEQIYLNGILQRPGLENDYTILNDQIEFVVAPNIEDIILVNYIYNAFIVSVGGMGGNSFSGDFFDLTNNPIDGNSTGNYRFVATGGADKSVELISYSANYFVRVSEGAGDQIRGTLIKGPVSIIDSQSVGSVGNGKITFPDGTSQTTAWSGSIDYDDVLNTPFVPYSIDDLSDVLISNVQLNQYLMYDGTTWINAPLDIDLSFLQGDIEDLDLRVDTIEADIIGITSRVSDLESADLNFDSRLDLLESSSGSSLPFTVSNNNVGLGTSTPLAKLHITKTISSTIPVSDSNLPYELILGGINQTSNTYLGLFSNATSVLKLSGNNTGSGGTGRLEFAYGTDDVTYAQIIGKSFGYGGYLNFYIKRNDINATLRPVFSIQHDGKIIMGQQNGAETALEVRIDDRNSKGFVVTRGHSLSQLKSYLEVGINSDTGLKVDNNSNTVISNANLTVNNGTIFTQNSAELTLNNFNSTLSPSSGNLNINVSSASVFLGVLSSSVNTWAFTNFTALNGRTMSVTVVIDGNTSNTYGDACTVNGISISDGIKWAGGSAPSASDNFDIITFTIIKDNSGNINVFGMGSVNYS